MSNLIVLTQDGTGVLDHNDTWRWLPEDAEPIPDSIIPFERWKTLDVHQRSKAVALMPHHEPEELAPFLSEIHLIALTFEDFKDGRPYSSAHLLRTRLGFKGDIRAVGDVLRDQLSLMRQCGFTSFLIKEGKDPQDALLGLKGISVTYSGSTEQPNPLFKRVRRV